MISKKMTDALNKQINAELYSSYLYLSMSAWASFNGLKGTANWMFIQAREEMTHAWRFYNYINGQGQHAVLSAIAGPDTEFKSLKHVFEETLAHEKKVTAMINNLADLADKEKDHATEVVLQWFISEQVEEEGNAKDILDKLKLAGGDGSGLFMIDNELGARMFVMPPDLAGATA